MASVGRITIDLMSRTAQFSQGLRSAQGDLTRFAGKAHGAFRGIGASAASLALPTGIGYGFIQAIESVEQFNRAMAKSMSIMDGVDGTMRRRLVDQANAVAFETIHSNRDLAATYYELASAGLDAERSLGALPAVAKFAQASGTDLTASTHLLTTAISALGLASKDAAIYQQNLSRVSDVLARAANVSEATIQGLSEALTNKAAASARLLGQDVEEVVAVLSVFAKQGKEGEAAGEAYAIVMRDLQNAAIENQAAFRSMGIEVFDSAGNMRSVAGIISQLEAALGSLSDEQKRVALKGLGFQDRSVHQIQSLLGFSDEISRIMQDLRTKAAGESQRVADAMVTPFQKASAQLKAAWSELTEVAGTPLLGFIAQVTGDMAGLVKATNEAATAFRDLAGASKDASGGDKEDFDVVKFLGKGATGPAGLISDLLKKEKAGVTAAGVGGLAAAISEMKKQSAPVGKSIAEEIAATKPPGPVGAVGAVESQTAEAYNNLQKAIHGGQEAALKEEQKQTKILEEQRVTLKDIRRALDRPETEVEFV